MINVTIPVYLGLHETQRCIESVLAARCETTHEVVVIDDASPDEAISAWLRTVERSGRIRLIVHPANQGFVASVNEGMQLDPDRDVLLLNSDTEVADGWLDRLVACADREPDAGTVTPFSSNATICSYPKFCASNALPEGETTASLDRRFAAVNAGASMDVPTAVGFCMLITRECLGKVGYFDEETFGRGYGEEVDFCMRAARAGFRNLHAADVFVFHEGEVSFRDSGVERRQAAQRIVDDRYPEFQVRLREYLDREPARAYRRAIDLARLGDSPRPRVVLFSSTAPIPPDVEPLLLAPAEEGSVCLSWHRPGEEFRAWFHPATDALLLQSLLRGLAAALPAAKVPPELRELVAALRSPTRGVPAVPSLEPRHWRAPLPGEAQLAPPESPAAPKVPSLGRRLADWLRARAG